MECKNIHDRLVDYIDNRLPIKEAATIEAHIKSCNNCEKALREMREIVSTISKEILEHPSKNLRSNFDQMLDDEKQLQQAKIVQLKPKKNWKSFLQIAATIILVFSSFLFGRYQKTQQFDKEVTELKNETLASKQTTILALMDNQSASKRIQGVQYVEEFSDLDPEIIEALVKRMMYDENTNVRLTAVNALQEFITSEKVKEGFIKALESEKDPTIQITIIQSLVKIQEKKALKPMQELLKQDETQPFVKEEIRLAISNIT